MSELQRALAIVANARPEDLARHERHRAVAGIDFSAETRPRPGPSMAGQSPANSALIAAREAVHAEAVERDAQARRRREENLEAEVRVLQAGQAPENLAAIKATVCQG